MPGKLAHRARSIDRMDRDADLEAAWAEVHADTPEGWYFAGPSEHPEHQE